MTRRRIAFALVNVTTAALVGVTANAVADGWQRQHPGPVAAQELPAGQHIDADGVTRWDDTDGMVVDEDGYYLDCLHANGLQEDTVVGWYACHAAGDEYASRPTVDVVPVPAAPTQQGQSSLTAGQQLDSECGGLGYVPDDSPGVVALGDAC